MEVADKITWLNYRLANGGRKSSEQLEAEAMQKRQVTRSAARNALRERWRNSALDFQREAVAYVEQGYGWQDVLIKFGGSVTAEEDRTLVLGG